MRVALIPGQVKILSKMRWVSKRTLHVIALCLADGELLILVTDSRPETALNDYARRWGIETLFAALKTRGFIVSSIKNETSWLCSTFPRTAFRPAQRSQSVLKIIGLTITSKRHHFRNSPKLSKLLALLAIAFTWAIRAAGLWLHQQKPLELKSHGRHAKSLLCLGLDFLRCLCLDIFPSLH